MKSVGIWLSVAAYLAVGGLTRLSAGDWPQWRYDANRSADSSETLPANLSLHWVREYSPREPAWEDPLNQDLMPFDAIFEPIVAGGKMLVPFNDRDKLVALDIRTGREVWIFYADGPVRLAPAAWKDRVFLVSDDGWLYCVRLADGVLLWKYRGGPSERKALGNSRLVSAWPARGGPVVRDNTVFFAASVWPFMGTFVHALDAETGRVKWINDGTGSKYLKQPHSAPSFAGVAPQGSLVATEKILLVPGGRSVPAAFDLQTGNFLYYNISDSGKGTGGSFVAAGAKEFFVHTRLRGTRYCDLKDGRKSGSFVLNEPVIGNSTYYTAADHSTNLTELTEIERKLASAQYDESKARSELLEVVNSGDFRNLKRASNTWTIANRRLHRYETNLAALRIGMEASWSNQVVQAWSTDREIKWELPVDGSGDLIRAGGILFAAGADKVTAIQLPRGRQPPSVAWSHPLAHGQVRRLLAADDMLFGVTLEGRILAFGQANPSYYNAPFVKEEFQPISPAPAAAARARAILERTGVREGYAFCLGLEDGDLIAALASQSKLQLVGVDEDTNKVERLRRKFDAAGLYGRRITLMADDPASFGAPPYVAGFVVAGHDLAGQLGQAATLRQVYESVRPYGGVLWISAANGVAEGLAEKARLAQLPQAQVSVLGDAVVIVREGALPGSDEWTHQYGDVANSVKSDDRTVKLPLGLLWFGGNTHTDVLPRHGHGPSEQVVGGRLYIEGMDCLSARDVYTGRRLWKTVVPGLDTKGIYHDDTLMDDPLTTLYNQRHIPGANSRGANYVATADKVYVAVSNRCVVLEAASGAILKSFEMPLKADQTKPMDWAYIGVYEDILLGGVDFGRFNQRSRLAWPPVAADVSASKGLVAFNRHTGEILWQVEAKHSFINNGIVAGSNRVYCLDRLPRSAESRGRRRGGGGGGETPKDYRVAAFDIRTGELLWEQTNNLALSQSNNIFGSWLSYSRKHDVLLQAGASATDRLKDETTEGMMVLQAADGKIVWHKPKLKYNGPCILYNDLIITTPTSYKFSAGAYELLTGEPHVVTNPLTGAQQPWRFHRTYGCNTPVAAENLLTFRSGAAGFYDLLSHSGTGNLGGFKSGCSANLIIADGVLNAPDYTRTCSCPYQNQTSLAFVPMPDVEMWTCNFSAVDTPEGERIARIGLNLGAPGDRIAEDGTLWIEYPTVAGFSPALMLKVEPSIKNTFNRHPGSISGEGPAWVSASGAHGAFSLTLQPQTLNTPDPTSSSTPAPSKQDDKYRDYEELPIFAFDQTWRYEAGGKDLKIAWKEESFDDGQWPTGQGLLGFETTPNDYSEPFRTMFANYSGRIVTYYFRTEFVLTNDASGVVLLAESYIDDGAIFWLNGKEAGTYRMSSGANYRTGVSGAAPEHQLSNFYITPGALRQGKNVLAVEVHQSGNNSSDVVFGTKLTALIPPPSTNQLASTGTQTGSTTGSTPAGRTANNSSPNYDDEEDNGSGSLVMGGGSEDYDFSEANRALPPALYTVRLFFSEPDTINPGQRIFNVFLQEKPVLENFDILKETGAPNRALIKEFRSVLLSPALQVRLERSPLAALDPVLSGIELIFEGVEQKGSSRALPEK